MIRFFSRKHKKPANPPQQPPFPGKPANIAAGSSHLQEAEDAGPKGGRSPGYSTVATDDGGSHAVHRDRELESWTSAPTIGDTERGNELTNEGIGNTGIGETETARSRVSKKASKDVERFNPLKILLGSIPAACANHEVAFAVGKKIESLLSRIVLLENHFDSCPSSVAEQRGRDELRRRFEGIEKHLRSLVEISELRTEEFRGVLEDLREAMLHYQIIQQTEALNQQGCEMDSAEAAVLNNFRSAQGAEYQHGNRSGCLKGTRSAVLDAIEHWVGNFHKLPICWLNGLAGTGKTSIAQTVAERTFADGQLGASFFCSRDFEDRRNLHLILPTLAVQLARKYTQFRSVFVRLVRLDPEISDETLYNQMQKLIVRPLKESKISTVIVVDALDECKDQEPISAFLSVLGQFISEITEVKFLVTGRPEPRIREGFRLPLLKEVTEVFVLHGVEPKQVEHDIRLFLTHQFSELVRRRRGLDDWPAKEQLDLLCKRASGWFAHAVAIAEFVDNQSDDPIERLDLLLRLPKASGHQAGIKLNENTTVDSLYTSILTSAFGDDDDPDNDPKVRLVLGAMVLAANPISSSTIAVLLDLDAYQDVYPLLSSVQSLLIIREDINYLVRPFHKSFTDFIIDPDRCTDQRFYVSPLHHHSQLLVSCLALMGRKLEKNMCKLPAGVANLDVNDLKERAERYIDPALQYACRSWHTHLVGGRTTSVNTCEITSALHRFLESKFVFWLEVLSVLGAVRNAVDGLQVAADWLEESPTLDLANDCSRFVAQYFEIISTSSPHIYHSALVLTPKQSTVQELYKSHAQPFIKMVHGVPTLWGLHTAAATFTFSIGEAVWSPCNRFAAVSSRDAMRVDILDSATLQRLQSLRFPGDIFLPSEPLVFSPDSRMLTTFIRDKRPAAAWFVVSWDLQTGGVVSTIEWNGPRDTEVGNTHITYSTDGKMVAVFSRCGSSTIISIYDVVAGVCMHDVYHGARMNPDLFSGTPYVYKVWTHGELLRFATPGPTGITIWEVGFAPGATPAEVETLSFPDDTFGSIVFNPGNQIQTAQAEFHPASCRLAFFGAGGTLLVWDARASKFLLHHTGIDFRTSMTFSPDACLFACATAESEVYLWKESPTGYTHFEKLTPIAQHSGPRFSRNGESIITFSNSTIQLWHTKNFATATSNVLVQAPQHTGEDFVLEFLPDRSLAVAMRKKAKTVTVLDLKSGVPRLTIDTSIELYGLKLIGDTIVAIGHDRAITWNLPGENFPPNARMNVEDSIRTIRFRNVDYGVTFAASISLDFRYIALAGYDGEGDFLGVYCTSTGRAIRVKVFARALRFAPGGHDIWCATQGNEAKVFAIIEDALEHTKTVADIEDGSWGCPSRGCKVTNDGWILGAGEKRLLMLPPLWQSLGSVDRVWNGKFIALLHGTLPEPVILELES